LAKAHGIVNVGSELGESHLLSIRSGLAHQEQRQGLRQAAKRHNADSAAFQILEAADLGNTIWRDRQREQRQARGRGEPLDFGAPVDGLNHVVERGRAVVDRAADQGLRRRRAASHVNKIHVKTSFAEIVALAGDFERRDAQDCAAKGKLDRAAFGEAAACAAHDQWRCPGEQTSPLQHRAASDSFFEGLFLSDLDRTLEPIALAAIHGGHRILPSAIDSNSFLALHTPYSNSIGATPPSETDWHGCRHLRSRSERLRPPFSSKSHNGSARSRAASLSCRRTQSFCGN
jgi:hypothetical protein